MSGANFAASFIAECFWAGVTEHDLRELDERAHACVAELVGAGEDVRYRGSMLMRADEVVLCRFEGQESSVRLAAERARIPFERIIEISESPWVWGPRGEQLE